MAFTAIEALFGLRNAGLSYTRIGSITGISSSSIRRYLIGEVSFPTSRAAAVQAVSRTINYNILRAYGVSPQEAKSLRSRSITNILSTVQDLRNAYTRIGNAKGYTMDEIQVAAAASPAPIEIIVASSELFGSEEFTPRIIGEK